MDPINNIKNMLYAKSNDTNICRIDTQGFRSIDVFENVFIIYFPIFQLECFLFSFNKKYICVGLHTIKPFWVCSCTQAASCCNLTKAVIKLMLCLKYILCLWLDSDMYIANAHTFLYVHYTFM